MLYLNYNFSTMIKKFVDSFIVKEAPYTLEKFNGRKNKIFGDECYTEEFMFRMENTNQLCRWCVELEDGTLVSQFSYFGIRPTKEYWLMIGKMLRKMDKESRAFYFKSINSKLNLAYDEVMKFGVYPSNARICPEMYVISSSSKFTTEFFDANGIKY